MIAISCFGFYFFLFPQELTVFQEDDPVACFFISHFVVMKVRKSIRVSPLKKFSKGKAICILISIITI